MKKYIIIIGSILVLSLLVSAQEPATPITFQSPNVASLGLYRETPVSLYTGTPQIEIPIYTLKTNGIVLPISLSYDASGVRPDNHPGWVGTNWSLQCGGVITRTVRGLPDERIHINSHDGEKTRINGTLCNTKLLYGYFHNDIIKGSQNWVIDGFQYYIDAFSNAYPTENQIKNIFDTEPDEFSFSLPNCNGKFYLNDSRQWTVKCDKYVKVEFNSEFLAVPFQPPYFLPDYLFPPICPNQLQGGTAQDQETILNPSEYFKSFSGFTITTDDGVKYEFGGISNAIEYSIPFFNQFTDQWVANSWHLTKIIHPNGNHVDINYQRGDFVSQMYLSLKRGNTYITNLPGTIIIQENSDFNDLEKNINGSLVSPIYLSEIISNNEIVNFNFSTTTEFKYTPRTYFARYDHNYLMYAQGVFPFLQRVGGQDFSLLESVNNLKWKKLDQISVLKRDDNTPLKMFNFTYNNISNERLFLLQVSQTGGDNLKGNVYTFDYYKKDKIPNYLSNKLDSWGYYNGISAYLTDDPTLYTNTRNTVDNDKSKYGILTGITFPTGGYTKFIFENHDYSKKVSTNRWEQCITTANTIAGGLRVKKILKYDTNHYRAKAIDSTEYYYRNHYTFGNYGTSTGILSNAIQYHYDDYFAQIDSVKKCYKDLIISQSVLPNVMGGPDFQIVYSLVTEKKSDGSFIQYTFTNYDNGHLDEQCIGRSLGANHTYLPVTSKSHERGKLISITNHNNLQQIVSKKDITYQTVNTEFIKCLYSKLTTIDESDCGPINGDFSMFELAAFKIYTGSYLPKIEREYLYSIDGNTLISETVKQYSYNDHKFLNSQASTIKKNNSVTDEHSVEYRYPFDILSSEYEMLSNHNIIKTPIETIKKLNGKVIGANLLTYQNLLPSCNYSLKLTGPISNFGYYDGNNINPLYFEPELSITRYHNNTVKNIAEIKGKDGVYTTYLWGYKNEYPIAEIVNASYDQVKNVINEQQINSIANSYLLTSDNILALNNLRTVITNAKITIYSYKPTIGIVSATDPRGVTSEYQYDGIGRLKDVFLIEKNAQGVEVKKLINAYNYNLRIK